MTHESARHVWLQLQRLLTADVRSHCAEDARSAGQRTVPAPDAPTAAEKFVEAAPRRSARARRHSDRNSRVRTDGYWVLPTARRPAFCPAAAQHAAV